MTGPSRRQFVAGSAGVAAAAGLSLGAAAARPAPPTPASPGPAVPARPEDADRDAAGAVIPFHGAHQAGIATPPQQLATFLGLDLRPGTDGVALQRLLRLLTDDAARLTQGRPALADTEPELAAHPARLTVTVGLGPRVFEIPGLSARRPPAAVPLPSFRTDALRPRWGQTDLLLQVCTDSELTLSHTVRMLAKDARSFATVRWAQRGFTGLGRTEEGTPRNLMGQVDGTVNPVPGTPAFDGAVWASGGPGHEWFAGGTMVVLRRILMDLAAWDAFERAGREQVIGRRLDTGAPLTGRRERDVPDLAAVDADGFAVIEPNAHIRLAHARPGEAMLRRVFSYDDGLDADGRPDAGLLFAAYQADPRRAFVPVQERLAAGDLFNRWITHVGSAVYAVPPGVAEGGSWAQDLWSG